MVASPAPSATATTTTTIATAKSGNPQLNSQVDRSDEVNMIASATTAPTGATRRAARPKRRPPSASTVVNAPAAAPISSVWARANVFMYVAVGSVGSNITFIRTIDAAAPATLSHATV